MSAVVEHANNMSANVMALLHPVITAAGVLANPGLTLNSIVILGSGFLHSAFVFYEITSDRLEKEITSRLHDKEITSRFIATVVGVVVVVIVFMVLVFKYFTNNPASRNVEQAERILEHGQRYQEQRRIYTDKAERERAKKRRQRENKRLAAGNRAADN